MPKAVTIYSARMEWAITEQSLSVGNMRIGPFHGGFKPIAPISYSDKGLSFPNMTLILPPTIVKSYDTETGKLALSLQGHPSFYNKLIAIQNTILDTMYTNQRGWFSSGRTKTKEEIVAGFQPFVTGGCIHVYCPIFTIGSYNEIQVYSGGQWVHGTFSKELLASGKTVRIAVRLQGISFHLHPVTKEWTGRSRIQHRVLAIYE